MSTEKKVLTADEILRDMLWRKGHIIIGKQPHIWRKDDYGSPMQFDEYGNRDSPYGWEKDHIIRKKDGGSDDISNLRPLQWENNIRRNQEA